MPGDITLNRPRVGHAPPLRGRRRRVLYGRVRRGVTALRLTANTVVSSGARLRGSPGRCDVTPQRQPAALCSQDYEIWAEN
ncbi:hypothetical protein EVAR_3436_1 [Eumeta japonica]|uniref:Uncharacterized protein n=1 Tax=Eumeta variegata TaxID=151549 RepID=A0A4C1SV60_EUMVA|nr:hypothetical protein EVAR_3436_1 [Eumeta japonica]